MQAIPTGSSEAHGGQNYLARKERDSEGMRRAPAGLYCGAIYEGLKSLCECKFILGKVVLPRSFQDAFPSHIHSPRLVLAALYSYCVLNPSSSGCTHRCICPRHHFSGVQSHKGVTVAARMAMVHCGTSLMFNTTNNTVERYDHCPRG